MPPLNRVPDALSPMKRRSSSWDEPAINSAEPRAASEVMAVSVLASSDGEAAASTAIVAPPLDPVNTADEAQVSPAAMRLHRWPVWLLRSPSATGTCRSPLPGVVDVVLLRPCSRSPQPW